MVGNYFSLFSSVLKFIWRPGCYIALAGRYITGKAQEWIPKKTVVAEKVSVVMLLNFWFLLPCVPKVPYPNTGPDDFGKNQTSLSFYIYLCVCVYRHYRYVHIWESTTEFIWVPLLSLRLYKAACLILGESVWASAFVTIGVWLRWFMWLWLG